MTFFRELGAFFSSFGDPYFAKAMLLDFLRGVFAYFKEIYPYVILGSLLGEALKFTSWTKLIYRFTVSRPKLAVLTATVLGILSPLCTYGTVPVLIALYGAGVAVAPLISFLAASSMMNPQLFIMTAGGLGMTMALVRLACVFVFAFLCGALAHFLPKRFVVRGDLVTEMDGCADGAACGGEAILSRTKKKFTVKAYALSFGKNLWFVTRMMTLGIAIAAFVDLLPLSLLFGEADTSTVWGVIVAAFAGIPVYACGGGTVPMVASLMAQGLSGGSAIAFLTVGPATRITSLAAVASVFRKRFLALYVAVLLVFSVAVGMLLVAIGY